MDFEACSFVTELEKYINFVHNIFDYLCSSDPVIYLDYTNTVS